MHNRYKQQLSCDDLIPGDLYMVVTKLPKHLAYFQNQQSDDVLIKSTDVLMFTQRLEDRFFFLYGDKLCYCREETIRRDIWENSIGLWTIKET